MTTARPILIVEDDRVQRDSLAENLDTNEDFQFTLAASFAEADELLSAEYARFDAVVLSPGLRDEDGNGYCAKMRLQGYKMPVIIVAGSRDEADVVRELNAGANDYLPKPYRLNELLARLRAQLRVFDNGEDAVFTIGQFTFRPGAKLLLDPAGKRRFRLTGKEAAILRFLYHAGAQPVTRPVLLEKVWGYSSGAETHTLETHIYRLRQKLEANTADCRLLLTEPGGYRLNAAA